MSYFTALLAAAGLPVILAITPVPVTTPAPVPPTATTSTTVPTAASSIPGLVSVTQFYQTMLWENASPTSSGPTTATTGTTTPTPPPSSTTPPPSSTTSAPPSGSSGATSNAGGGSSSNTSGNTPQAMIALINQARVQAGLQPYTVNSTLMTLAQERAVALANGPFTSDLPGYGWPIQMEQAAGIQAQGMGAENIAEAGSVSQAFAMLMASPPHKSNILNPYETQIGVGVAPWGSGVAISELFIGP